MLIGYSEFISQGKGNGHYSVLTKEAVEMILESIGQRITQTKNEIYDANASICGSNMMPVSSMENRLMELENLVKVVRALYNAARPSDPIDLPPDVRRRMKLMNPYYSQGSPIYYEGMILDDIAYARHLYSLSETSSADFPEPQSNQSVAAYSIEGVVSPSVPWISVNIDGAFLPAITSFEDGNGKIPGYIFGEHTSKFIIISIYLYAIG
jgi:hypothetical protein